MAEYRLPTVEGRELLIRPTALASPRPQVQLAILSTRGNIIEAVTIEAGDVLGLARGAGKIAREANRCFAAAERERAAAADERHRAALARNPWQTLSPAELKRKGLV
jgi:hypothetical protein